MDLDMNEPIEEEKTLESGTHCHMNSSGSGEIQLKSSDQFKTSSKGTDTSVNTANQNFVDKKSTP